MGAQQQPAELRVPGTAANGRTGLRRPLRSQSGAQHPRNPAAADCRPQAAAATGGVPGGHARVRHLQLLAAGDLVHPQRHRPVGASLPEPPRRIHPGAGRRQGARRHQPRTARRRGPGGRPGQDRKWRSRAVAAAEKSRGIAGPSGRADQPAAPERCGAGPGRIQHRRPPGASVAVLRVWPARSLPPRRNRAAQRIAARRRRQRGEAAAGECRGPASG